MSWILLIEDILSSLLASLWNRGLGQLENSLLDSNQVKMFYIHFNRLQKTKKERKAS